MEFNNNYNYNKKVNRFQSVSNVFTNKLMQIERSNSNINSSTSKKTAGFEESLNFLTGFQKKMNSFSIEKDTNKLRFSCNNNLPVHQSQEFSMKDIKEKADVNGNYTNINISIVNPNFSINNIENSNRGTNITNKRVNFNIINNTLVSFKENNNINNIEVEEKESKKDNRKTIASIYKDYLENKSNDETFSENFKDETKKNMFKEYLKKKKIIQYEYNTKGIISGFAAYMYPNEEIINKDKICLNININKLSINEENDNKKSINFNSHSVNFFSLFCGGEKDDNDELPKFLKNNLKDIILNDKDIINNPPAAIKNGFTQSELNYINYYLEEEKNKQKTTDKSTNEQGKPIPTCSLFVLLNIDDIFYIGNLGSSVSLLSSNYSQKINYLSKEITSQDVYENNNYFDDKRKSINSLFSNMNPIEEDNNLNNLNNLNNVNIKNDKIENNNSQILFNESNISIINMNNNNYYINNLNQNTINSYYFIRTFPGKAIYDLTSKSISTNSNNNNNNNTNNINNKTTSNRRGSKNNMNSNINRRLSTTFGGLNSFNFKGKNLKLNNYMKNQKNKMKSNKDKDNPYISNQKNSISSIPNFKKYRDSFISQNTYDNFFGENKIISSYPDILAFKHQPNYHDFILIGCKKIFEKLSYDKICKGIYETMKKCIRKHRSFEMFLGCVVKDIIKKCISFGITSNISCLFICFERIKQLYLKQDINAVKNVMVSFYLPLGNKNRFEFYGDLLSSDFIDVDKANQYNNMFAKEIENINKKKNHFSTNIINKHEITSKIYENNNKSDDKIITQKIGYVRPMKRKCCCLLF